MSWKQILFFNQSKMGTDGKMCLQNSREGFGISSGHFHSAKIDWNSQIANKTAHYGTNFPSGKAVPVYGNLRLENGHVGVWNNGVFYSNGKVADLQKTFSSGGVAGWGELCDNRRVIQWVNPPTPVTISGFLPSKGYWGLGDTDARIGRLAAFMRKNYPLYTSVASLGNFYGDNIKHSITEFQKRTGLQADGNVGPITYAKLQSVGFKG